MADTEHYLNDMRSTTLEYARKWNIVALRMGLAYSKAYQNQQGFLKKIQKALEAKKKQEEAMMSFTFGLLTGGIIGPIADRVVKKFTKGGELSVLKDVVGKVSEDSLLTEWTGNAFKELAKLGDEKVREAGINKLKSEVAAEAFDPAGMTPHDYTASLQLGIEQRADAMSDIARSVHREFHHIPVEVAQAVNKAFLQSAFFTALPGEINETALERSAELMLWIAWGKLRDVRYWDVQKAILLYNSSEIWEWTPLLKELARLNAPLKQFTIKMHGMRGPIATVDMPAFIAWSKGATAPAAAFEGVPTKADDVRKAIDKYLKKNK